MVEIQGVLVSEEIFTEKFVCNLSACKGACCWEGDYGAPVSSKEMKAISESREGVLGWVSEQSVAMIQADDLFEYIEDADVHATKCHENGDCVFMGKDVLGIAYCSIERAHNTDPQVSNKPISCHLYPIRVTDNSHLGFEAWNYEEWDICSAACTQGTQLKVPVFRFLKEAIIRYKGEQFYEELEAAAQFLEEHI